MPQLEIFKFFFTAYVSHVDTKQFIKTFMSDFWLIEKKWYVTCDCDPIAWFLYVYTVPYPDDQFIYDEKLSCRTSTAKVNDMSNVHSFVLPPISKLIELKDRFTNIQSMKINLISYDETYDRLHQFLNISSIKMIVFEDEINAKLFFNILKYNKTDMSIEVSYTNLMNMLRNINIPADDRIGIPFTHVRQLITSYFGKSDWKETDIVCMGHAFPNIQQLTIRYSVASEMIPVLLCNFKKLSFLTIECFDYQGHFQKMQKSAFQYWFSKRAEISSKKSIHCEKSRKKFHLIID